MITGGAEVSQLFGTAATAASSAVDKTAMGKDDFLMLLLEQIKGQDPLNPQDPSEFTAQLTQFSSLEQLFNLGDQLKDLITVSVSLNNASAASFLNRQAVFEGDTIQMAGGQASEIQYDLSGAATGATLHILDASGNEVRAIDLGALPAGEGRYQWDGQTAGGAAAPDGAYSYRIEAFDAAAQPVGVTSYWTGQITGITYENGVAYLEAGGQRAPLSDVVSVRI